MSRRFEASVRGNGFCFATRGSAQMMRLGWSRLIEWMNGRRYSRRSVRTPRPLHTLLSVEDFLTLFEHLQAGDEHERLEFKKSKTGGILMVMGKAKETPVATRRQFLTDENGKPTHVVVPVDEFQEMEELIEDLQAFQEFRENRDKEKLIPLSEVKKSLGL